MVAVPAKHDQPAGGIDQPVQRELSTLTRRSRAVAVKEHKDLHTLDFDAFIKRMQTREAKAGVDCVRCSDAITVPGYCDQGAGQD